MKEVFCAVDPPSALAVDIHTRPDGKSAYFVYDGTIYLFDGQRRTKPLFNYKGFSTTRRVTAEGGFFEAVAEVGFYCSIESGEILNTWTNDTVEQKVVPVQNRRVHRRILVEPDGYTQVSLDGTRKFGRRQAPRKFRDDYVFSMDFFPFYPLDEFVYSAAEFFSLRVPITSIQDGTLRVSFDWSRVGPSLPWMGKVDGLLLYHCMGERVDDWAEVPKDLRQVVESEYPDFREAPDSVDPSLPNESSWSRSS
jgi:hypothetical protein